MKKSEKCVCIYKYENVGMEDMTKGLESMSLFFFFFFFFTNIIVLFVNF